MVRYGDRIAGTIEAIGRKTDDDAAERPYAAICRIDVLGTGWIAAGSGRFTAEGAETRGVATKEYGFDRTAGCPGDFTVSPSPGAAPQP